MIGKSDSVLRFGQRLSVALRKLGPTLLAGLSASAIAAVLFAWLASEMLEGETRAFDETVRGFIHQHASPAITSLMSALTLLGSTVVLLAFSVCVILVFLRIGEQHAAVLFALTMGGAFLLNGLLKLSFQRTRPVPYFELTAPTSYSFPSGHALYSFCFYGTLSALITVRIGGRAAQSLIWMLAVLLIILIGLSRVYLGVHYPSDVVAGYAAALVWVSTIAFGDYLLHRKGRS